MKSLRKLRRKLLFRNYGFLASSFLKIIAPLGADLDKLKKWHHSLMMIKNFSDLYLKSLIYLVILICILYSLTSYILSIISFEEIVIILSDWFEKIKGDLLN